MYRYRIPKEHISLFEELFPYGGKLDDENRWMKISRIMPWEELESLYARTFSNWDRPGKESRLILGAFTIKHVLKARGMYVDASVIPVGMAYPSDVTLLEKGRRFLVRFVNDAGRKLGRGFRTYARIARKTFVSFSKKRHKTRRCISIARPHIRPIVRGKAGKDVEFGPKVSLAYVDGYCFCDAISHEAYNETTNLSHKIREFKKCFEKPPDFVSGDQIYGSYDNRNYLESRNIRHAFKPDGSGLSRAGYCRTARKRKIRP